MKRARPAPPRKPRSASKFDTATAPNRAPICRLVLHQAVKPPFQNYHRQEVESHHLVLGAFLLDRAHRERSAVPSRVR